MECFIGLGSNLGQRGQHLSRALEQLARCGLRPRACSAVWETEPVGSSSPHWFWNMVVAAPTERSPRELLDLLLGIERDAGRVRDRPNADRVLDLDLLLVGQLVVDLPGLRLPHPRMWQREFVLAPLAEIAPQLRNPHGGLTVSESLQALRPTARVRRIGSLATRGSLLL